MAPEDIKEEIEAEETKPVADIPTHESLCETLAKELYTVYCEQVGGYAFNGDLLPTWEAFRADPSKSKQSDAWVVVASKAMYLLK